MLFALAKVSTYSGEVPDPGSEEISPKQGRKRYDSTSDIVQVKAELRQMQRFPLFLVQFGGFFPYTQSLESELKLSPTLISISILRLGFLFFDICSYASFHPELESTFGDFTDTEKYTGGLFFGCAMVAQILLRVSLLRNNTSYISYHSSLVNLIAELVADDKQPIVHSNGNRKIEYLNWMKTNGKRLANLTLFITFGIVVNIGTVIFMFTVVPMSMQEPLSMLTQWERIRLMVMTADLSTVIMTFTSMPVFLVSYISMMELSFRIIKRKAGEASFSPKLLLDSLKKLEKVVKEFNSIYQVHAILWLVFAVGIIIYDCFSIFLWLKYQYYIALVSVILPIGGSLMGLFFLCDASSRLTSQSRDAVDMICKGILQHDFERPLTGGTDGNACNPDRFLLVQASFLHAKWQTNPCRVSPGGFFNLNRRVLTSVAGLVTTYLIVLVQFSGDEVPGWAEIWRSRANLTGNFNGTLDVDL